MFGGGITGLFCSRLCLMIASYVHGADERSRLIRRTLGRYLILLQALTFQAVSTSVKRRFPTTQHFVTAGILFPFIVLLNIINFSKVADFLLITQPHLLLLIFGFLSKYSDRKNYYNHCTICKFKKTTNFSFRYHDKRRANCLRQSVICLWQMVASMSLV